MFRTIVMRVSRERGGVEGSECEGVSDAGWDFNYYTCRSTCILSSMFYTVDP